MATIGEPILVGDARLMASQPLTGEMELPPPLLGVLEEEEEQD